MIPKILSLSTLWVFAGAHGKGELGSVGHGLIGYGIEMWQPVCAFACRDVLSSSRLRCSTMSHEDKTKRHNDSTAYETSTECFAENKPYLLTLAQCLHERCDGRAEHWELVRFWTTDATFSVQHRPVFDFEEALRSAQNRSGSLPVAELHGTLAIASRISDHDWNFSFEGLNNYVYVEKRHSLHGILLISLLILIPIAVHLARLARLPTLLERKTAAVLTHSALLGQRHAVPLPYDLGILPTRGQAIFITSIITLNVCLLFKGYRIANPDVFNRFPAHLANRAGVLSLANLTLMMLCSSRKNLAVRFTKWSHSTMLLNHRWVAYVCVGEALMHGTIYFILHIPYLARKFMQAYWNLGVISVGLMCMAVPLSSLPVRKRAYELFIDSHILLSVVILAGCYYHIHLEFRGSRGYESWICLAAFLWVGDRVMRLVKLLSNGIKTAAITYIDEEYARIDIPGVKASGHAYLYFPGLSWRLWQNHPFSIAASVHEFSVCGQYSYERASAGEGAGSEHQQPLLAAENVSQTHRHELKPSSSSSSLASLLGESSDRSSAIELEKLPQHSKPQVQNYSRSHQITGLMFYIRRQRGMTVKLFETTSQTLKVLIEGPYRPLPFPNIATCATLVCIAGGVGISTALPVLTSHALIGRSVLYWGCRSQGLVDAVDLDGLQRAGVEIHVKVRSRWEVRGIVTEEAQMGLSRGDVIVLTSGPNEMADDVRAAVVAANLTAAHPGRRRIRLVEESFSW